MEPKSFLLQSMSSYCMYWGSTSILSSSLHLGLSCSENMFSVSKNYIFITVIHNWRQQKWKCRQMLRGCVIVKFHLNALYTMIYIYIYIYEGNILPCSKILFPCRCHSRGHLPWNVPKLCFCKIKIMCISLEALVATEFSEIFLGRQLRQDANTMNN